ncbi:MAG: CopG family transcriptional regulator [Chloroflexi bacterium]|nr:CopG family transcriptional regulator [Chloroflexota bacterium]
MKVKTSITLSEDLLETVDRFALQYKNRSEFIEFALRKMIAQMNREQQDARDVEIINQHLDELNAEAEDVLGYQVIS